MLRKIEGKTSRRWQRMKWLDSITDSIDVNLSKLWETVEDRGPWQATVHGVPKRQGWETKTTIAAKVQIIQAKINNGTTLYLKSFPQLRKSENEKATYKVGKKIVNYVSEKGLISKIYKDLIQFNKMPD